jgi:NADP-dependent 3-hydroxy acid dehydrogenase YdfG
MTRLSNTVVLVTGASSGIGDATARLLAREGAAVVLAARRADRLDALRRAIEAEGGRALAVPTDITDADACAALVQAALDTYGRLDVLVNNAGVMPLSFVKNARLDEWRRMVDVNLTGVLNMTAAALPHFVERSGGHIVNVSSVAGRRVFVGGAVYCATKHAVTAFSEGLRMELGPRHGIRVTCVEPGAVATELPQAIADDEFIRDGPPFRATPLQPEDVAESILHALTAPARATINEIMVMPTNQVA